MSIDQNGRTYLNISSPKRELFEALKLQVERAEAAEARAAANDTALIEAAQTIAELREQRDKLLSERTAAKLELQQIRMMLDDGAGNEDDTALDMVKRLQTECRALQLESWYRKE